jgi:hypothetical protein
MAYLARKDFLTFPGIGAVKSEEGLYATCQGDSSGDRPIAAGKGAAATATGGDGIIVVLNGFPSFLQGKCYYVNLNKIS